MQIRCPEIGVLVASVSQWTDEQFQNGRVESVIKISIFWRCIHCCSSASGFSLLISFFNAVSLDLHPNSVQSCSECFSMPMTGCKALEALQALHAFRTLHARWMCDTRSSSLGFSKVSLHCADPTRTWKALSLWQPGMWQLSLGACTMSTLSIHLHPGDNSRNTVYSSNMTYHDISWTTSSTAQGGGGSFKDRKPIGEVGCCESRMAERIHRWTERWLELCFFEWLQCCSGHLTTTAGCSLVWCSCSCSCSVV